MFPGTSFFSQRFVEIYNRFKEKPMTTTQSLRQASVTQRKSGNVRISLTGPGECGNDKQYPRMKCWTGRIDNLVVPAYRNNRMNACQYQMVPSHERLRYSVLRIPLVNVFARLDLRSSGTPVFFDGTCPLGKNVLPFLQKVLP